MILQEVLDIFSLLDRADANGKEVADFLKENGVDEVTVTGIKGQNGSTDGLKIKISGYDENAPALGIIGRLGGLGARPKINGFVSDGDGALTSLAAALKIARMKKNGDQLKGDVIISTHVCPDAPTREHKPVPFMDSPVGIDVMNDLEVDEDMDAIISVDTTKGNNIITNKGISMSPTVKEGYILRVSEDLLDIMMRVTGKAPNVFALAQQDITPYGNDL